MKFLQTGDWHLGKIFFEQTLLKDQQYFFTQIEDILKQAQNNFEPYDAIIIPGDLYDRCIPPAEAVASLSSFLTKIRNSFPTLQIFILAGNHDSAERLSFVKDILKEQNIHICTDCNSIKKPAIVSGTAVYQIPFLQPGCLNSYNNENSLFEPSIKNQQELLDKAVCIISSEHKKKYKDMPAVLCAHLFATGSLRSESERIPVGTAEQVSSSSFDFFTYTALGHLHSFQKAGKNAYYSGSPLCYSFAESLQEKYILSVTIENKDTFNVEKIPVKPLHKCSVIKSSFSKLLEPDSFVENKDDYVQVICKDKEIIANPISQVRKKFPYILSFSYEMDRENKSETSTLQERRDLLTAKDKNYTENIFRAFLKDIYGSKYLDQNEIDFQKEIKMFTEIASNVEE